MRSSHTSLTAPDVTRCAKKANTKEFQFSGPPSMVNFSTGGSEPRRALTLRSTT
jgi:predicted metal-binding protein